jgi:hypothetical protein
MLTDKSGFTTTVDVPVTVLEHEPLATETKFTVWSVVAPVTVKEPFPEASKVTV